MSKLINFIVCSVLCVLPVSGIAAEQRFGNYIVHYNAFASDFLSPEIATHYGITRSRNRAILNITVQQETANGERVPVSAKIEATATNLHLKYRPLELRTVNEAEAIYELAEFDIINGQTINFNISISTTEQAVGTITFKQQFFTD